VPDVTQAELDRVIDAVAAAACRARVVTTVGAERLTVAGRGLPPACCRPTASGSANRSRPRSTRPRNRTTSPASEGAPPAAGVTFGLAKCHEAFRHPEITRAAALDGA